MFVVCMCSYVSFSLAIIILRLLHFNSGWINLVDSLIAVCPANFCKLNVVREVFKL